MDLKSYWNNVYDKKDIERLGWYEETPEPSLRLIGKCNLSKKSQILNVGVGASTLIDKLLHDGFENIIASDISSSSLNKLKIRLGSQESKKVTWIVDDLTKPTELSELDQIDLWHDRAVLHFLMEEKEQQEYFKLLKGIVRIGGYVIIASYNLDGATKCSGLPVFRYNTQEISSRLGEAFDLLDDFNFTYTMPSGDTREYTYTLYKRKKE